MGTTGPSPSIKMTTTASTPSRAIELFARARWGPMVPGNSIPAIAAMCLIPTLNCKTVTGPTGPGPQPHTPSRPQPKPRGSERPSNPDLGDSPTGANPAQTTRPRNDKVSSDKAWDVRASPVRLGPRRAPMNTQVRGVALHAATLATSNVDAGGFCAKGLT